MHALQHLTRILGRAGNALALAQACSGATDKPDGLSKIKNAAASQLAAALCAEPNALSEGIAPRLHRTLREDGLDGRNQLIHGCLRPAITVEACACSATREDLAMLMIAIDLAHFNLLFRPLRGTTSFNA